MLTISLRFVCIATAPLMVLWPAWLLPAYSVICDVEMVMRRMLLKSAANTSPVEELQTPRGKYRGIEVAAPLDDE